MKIVQLMLSPLGHIGRRQFWIVALPALFAALIAWRLARVGAWSAAAPLIFAVLWVLACITAKRLRHAGYRPWLILAPIVLAIIPGLADMLMWAARHATGLGEVAGPLVFAVNLRLLIWLSFVFIVWAGLSKPKVSA